jgi:phospholipase C
VDIGQLKQSIDTIFIVMLENRSFDHVLGVRGGKVPPLTNPSSWDNRPFEPVVHRDAWIDTDLPHERARVRTSFEGGMRGFVKAYEEHIGAPSPADCPPMWLCDPVDLPVTTFLADQFCVCTRWHASLPCDTQPNRLMAMSGTTRIDVTDINPVAGRWLPDQYTVLDWLVEKRGSSPFAVYVDGPFVPGIRYPTNFYLMKRLHPLLAGRTSGFSGLAADVATWDPGAVNPAARPPAVVYCEPFYNDLAVSLPVGEGHGNCNHPPLPMAYGEEFLRKVYEAVRSNPKVWARSLIVVTCDEHGGFFDHVPPPPMPFDPPEGASWSTPFETLGVRVPTILISPWVAAGTSCDLLFDHTSLLQLITERFGGPEDLVRFGHAPARKAAGVASVREALANTPAPQRPSPAPSPPPVPVPSPGGPVRPPPSGNARLWGAHIGGFG